MGAFFTNLHVAAGSNSPEDLVPDVSSAIDAAMARAGLKRCSDGDQKTRELVLVPSGRWLAVLDSTSEQQQGEHSKLAAELSAVTKRATTAFLVHDSDVFDAELFDGGKRADKYVNRPGYFEDVGEEESDAVQGDPQAWAALGGAEARRDGDVFAANNEVFCEEQTAALAEALGMSPQIATLGYHYFTELDDGTSAAVRLAYCEKNPPKKVDGAPRLELNETSKRTLAALSGEIEYENYDAIDAHALPCGWAGDFHLQIDNLGGAHRGIAVSLEGKGLANPLVELTGASLRHDGALYDLALRTEGTRRVADLAELVLHEAGYRPPDHRLGDPPSSVGQLELAVRFFVEATTKIPLRFSVDPIGAGTGCAAEVELTAVERPLGAGHFRQHFIWPTRSPSLEQVIAEIGPEEVERCLRESRLIRQQAILSSGLTLLRVRDRIIVHGFDGDGAAGSGALASIRTVLEGLGGQAGTELRGEPAPKEDPAAIAKRLAGLLTPEQMEQLERLGLIPGAAKATKKKPRSKSGVKPKPKGKARTPRRRPKKR